MRGQQRKCLVLEKPEVLPPPAKGKETRGNSRQRAYCDPPERLKTLATQICDASPSIPVSKTEKPILKKPPLVTKSALK